MKNVKKLLSLVLVPIMFVSLLAGCGSEAPKATDQATVTPAVGSSPQSTPAEQVEADMSKKLDIIWYGLNIQGLLPLEENVIENKLEEMFNVEITNVPVDMYNKDQENVLLATGVKFDVMVVGKDIDTMYNTGIIRELDEEMLNKYIPSMMDQLKKYSPNGEWKRMYSKGDKLYAIAPVSPTYATPIAGVVREDWMKAVGVTKIPETLQELEDLYIKFRENDPDQNGKKDTYALSKFSRLSNVYSLQEICPYIFGAYDLALNTWLIGENGEPVNPFDHPNFKEVLKIMNRWYEKEILDPEVVLDLRKELTAKFIEGKIGSYYGTEWALAKGHSLSPLELASKAGQEIGMVYIPPVKGETGVANAIAFGDVIPSNTGLYFGKDTSDEKVIRILQILNKVYTDEALFKLVSIGEEGVHYNMVDGYVVKTPLGTDNEEITRYGIQRYYKHNHTPDNFVKYLFDKDRDASWNKVKDYPMVPRHPYTGLATEADNTYKAAVEKIAEEFSWKAITGEIDIDKEWDSYVEQINAAGLKQMKEEKLKQYDELK